MRTFLRVWLGLLLITPLQAAYITDKLVAGLYEEAKVSDKPLKALPSGTPLEVVSRSNGFVKVRTPDGIDGWVEAAYLTDEKPARTMLLDAQAKLSILQKQLEQAKGRLANTADADAASATADADAAAGNDLQNRLAQARGQVSQLEIQLQAAKLELKNARQQLQQSQQQHASEIQQLQQQAEQSLQQVTEQNELLQQRINQVAELLRIPQAAPLSAPPTPSTDASGKPDWSDWKSNYWLWLVPLLALMLGFIGGMAFLHHRISKRFGGFRF